MPPHGRILIVDDEANARSALAELLAAEGYSVETAADGLAALPKLDQFDPELVLTDLRMPGMGGIELIRRSRTKDPDRAFVVMTAQGTGDSAVTALLEGATAYLAKPLRFEEIVRAVEEGLARRRRRADRLFPRVSDDVVARYDVPGPRYTSYPPVPEWTTAVGGAAYGKHLVRASREEGPLSLYVHLPFCREMCTYCGCNVIVSRDPRRADPYLDTLDRELGLVAAALGKRRSFHQLHLGGGTPTFLSEEQLERLCTSILSRFRPAADAELAVEIDPAVTTHGQLALLARHGWNRASFGVQDLDPEVQRAINREQSAAVTEAAMTSARSLGYGGLNVDLIYGLPRQTPESWRRTLDRVIAMRPDRAAVYSFAYLPDLRPHQRRLDAGVIPRGTQKLALFAIAYEAFVAAGYRPIGMDHFALPDDELARAQASRTLSRNFQGYTSRGATDVVAFGITGISDVGGGYFQNARPLSVYTERLSKGAFATERGLLLTADDRRRRDVITSLMCNFWVDLGTDGPSLYGRELEELAGLEREGLVRLDGSQVELTPLGRVFVRNVAMVFDARLQRGEVRPAFSATV